MQPPQDRVIKSSEGSPTILSVVPPGAENTTPSVNNNLGEVINYLIENKQFEFVKVICELLMTNQKSLEALITNTNKLIKYRKTYKKPDSLGKALQ